MNAEETCIKCDEVTPHVPSQRKFVQAAMKTVKIIIFFISFGMVYPHIFAGED